MRFPRRSLAAVAAVILVAAAMAVYVARPVAVEAIPVRIAPMRQTVVLSGRVLAPAKVAIGATITGRVERVAVDEGDRIARGQPMIALERAELLAALAQARAVETAAATRILQWKDVDATLTEQQLRQAEANLRIAERNADRQERLASQGFVGEAAVDEARRTLEVTRSQLETARAAARANAAAGPGRRLLDDQLASARAARETAAARLEQTLIEAPAAGVVLERNVEPGDVVQPGRTLMTLAVDGPVRLTALVDEKNLALLRVGQRARVSADAFPDETFDAVLDYLSPGVDVQRGTVEAKLGVARPPAFLRADMTVSIDIEVAGKAQAIVVPAVAVHDPRMPEPWVAVMNGGRAERRAVVLGARTASDIEIVRGLAAGEEIIVSPDVKPGTRVRRRGA